MLLEEIERAELHDPAKMPAGHAGLKSHVTFLDEKTQQVREVQLVLPAEADIAKGRVSILTPMGAALYGLAAGQTIHWPDLNDNHCPIRIIRVTQVMMELPGEVLGDECPLSIHRSRDGYRPIGSLDAREPMTLAAMRQAPGILTVMRGSAPPRRRSQSR